MSFLQPLQLDFPNTILSITESYGMPTLVIRKESVSDVMNYLYSQTDMQFHFLTDLCGVHYPNIDELPDDLRQVAADNPDIFTRTAGVFGVVYHLHNLYKNCRLRVKTFTPVEDPSISSLTSLFSAADWMERETYDFFGIEFRGHPNLTRILNMDEMTYFPLRKEYALEDATRKDKNDSFFGRTQGNV